MNTRRWLYVAVVCTAQASAGTALAAPPTGPSLAPASLGPAPTPVRAPAAAPTQARPAAPNQGLASANVAASGRSEPVGAASVPEEGLVDESGAEERPAAPSEAAERNAPSEDTRTWLRQPRQSAAEPGQTTGSNWSMSLVALVLLGGLAGGAVFMKWRRGGAPAPWMPPAPVRVLSTTRLSPKASLITADVHGRVLLLGVTEQTVSELGWIDETAEARVPEDEEEDDARPTTPPSVAVTRSGFGQVLGNVFGATERKAKEPEFKGNPNVAALIAARDTRDVVTTTYGRATAGAERRSPAGDRRSPATRSVAPEAPPVETQVAGLVRRRR